MIDVVLFVLAGIGLFAASYNDLKTREVPDWISHGLIYAALGIRLIYAVALHQPNVFLTGLYGFGICFAVSLGLFYLRQWGGGDAKVMMGIGAVFGFSILLAFFAVSLLFVGAFYGLAYSAYLAFSKRKSFAPMYHKERKGIKNIIRIAYVVFAISLISLLLFDAATSFLIVALAFTAVMGVELFVFVKAVEQSCLLQRIPISKVTEGDWIAEEVKINSKIVIHKNNTGITKEQLEKLKNYHKLLLVRSGVPFIPAFFLSFILVVASRTLIVTLLPILI